MIEEWRPIPGFEGYYSVSDLGCVRSERRVVKHARMGTNTIRERILKASPNNKGYRRVSLQRKGVILERGVHQVVALAFIGECPPAHQARHWDGDKTNNAADNIVYGTSSENHDDCDRHGRLTRGEKSGKAVLNEAAVREIRERKQSQRALARKFGVTRSGVCAVLRGTSWRHLLEAA